jgi:hypothetical protein
VSAGAIAVITTIAGLVLTTGTMFVVNGLMGLLSKKGTPAQNQLLTVRQAVAPRRVIYGSVRAGGIITFIALDSTGQYLYLVITLTGHEVSAINTMYFDNIPIALDGNGDATNVTSGNGLNYYGYVHAEKNLGTTGQSAFAGLVAATVGWTTAHRQRGCAGVYVRLKFNASLFNGLPNITFDIDGRKCYDPRSTSTYFTQNVALCINDYLTSTDFGLGVDYASRIDATLLSAAANCCDESVATIGRITRVVVTVGNAGTGYAVGNTISLGGYGNGDAVLTVAAISGGGGTGPVVSLSVTNPGTGYSTTSACTTGTNGSGSGLKVDITAGGTTEKRYYGNGIFDLTQTPVDIVKYLSGAMAGAVCYLGGKWRLYAGAYRSPSITLTEYDLAGPIQYQSRASARDVVNTIKGTYVSPSNDWQASDFPSVTNSSYVTEDGGVVTWQEIQLPFTSSSATAQRLATILLNDMRRQGVLDLQCKLTAYNAWPMDVIQVTNAHFGWSAKTFQVLGVSLTVDDTGALIYNLHCKETDSNIWGWTSAQEGASTGRGPVVLPMPHPIFLKDYDTLDNVTDGATYARPLGTALTSGAVDLTRSGVINKTLDYVADGTTRMAPTATRMNAATDATGNLLFKYISTFGATTNNPSTASVSYVSLAEMAGSFTATGLPVTIHFDGLFYNSTAGQYVAVTLYKDGSPITTVVSRFTSPSANVEGTCSFNFLDTPTAATHTYAVYWCVSGGTGYNTGKCRNFTILQHC